MYTKEIIEHINKITEEYELFGGINKIEPITAENFAKLFCKALKEAKEYENGNCKRYNLIEFFGGVDDVPEGFDKHYLVKKRHLEIYKDFNGKISISFCFDEYPWYEKHAKMTYDDNTKKCKFWFEIGGTLKIGLKEGKAKIALA